jgi:hypothetical protein
MTVALKNFLKIHQNAKPCQLWVDVLAMSHNLTGISIWSFLEHLIVLTNLLREQVGDIFKRGGGARSIFYDSSSLTSLIDQEPCTRTHRYAVVHVISSLPFPSLTALSLLPFLSHEVVFLRRMQQSALTLFTDATAEGSAV